MLTTGVPFSVSVGGTVSRTMTARVTAADLFPAESVAT